MLVAAGLLLQLSAQLLAHKRPRALLPIVPRTPPAENSERGRVLIKSLLRLGPAISKRDLWNLRCGHSGLMLAARITLPHFSVSSAMSLPKSVAEPTSGVLPKSASRALIL